MSRLRLHSKHGLNPTIPTCFWCGKDKNEIALLGAKYPGEAPMHMVVDYQPCEDCQAKMAQGVTLIEASPRPRGNQPAIQKGAYPTGRWWVITHEAARRIFDVTVQDKAFIEVGVAAKLGLVPDLTGSNQLII